MSRFSNDIKETNARKSCINFSHFLILFVRSPEISTKRFFADDIDVVDEQLTEAQIEAC